MSSYGLIETTMDSKEKLCIDYALKPWPTCWQISMKWFFGRQHSIDWQEIVVASDPLKPTFSAIVRLPPQSIDKKIYPCVFHGSRSVERNITYYQASELTLTR